MNKQTKMGRPIKNKNPRKNKLTLMFSDEEKQDIEHCSQILEISRTDAIVKAISLLKNNL